MEEKRGKRKEERGGWYQYTSSCLLISVTLYSSPLFSPFIFLVIYLSPFIHTYIFSQVCLSLYHCIFTYKFYASTDAPIRLSTMFFYPFSFSLSRHSPLWSSPSLLSLKSSGLNKMFNFIPHWRSMNQISP